MATRWERARATTRRTKERKAISRFSLLLPRPASISGASCATATGPTESRSHAIFFLFFRGPPGVSGGRAAQGRPAQRKADPTPFGGGVRGPARLRSAHLRTGGCRILLLAGGPSLLEGQNANHRRGAQDLPPGGPAASRRV